MDLQTLIVAIIVGVAAASVVRAFTRQFSSRDHEGCGSCAHGGSVQPGMTRHTGQAGQTRHTGQTRLTRQASASRDDELIQIAPIRADESIRE